jgi:preprotein translocase subunit YajC
MSIATLFFFHLLVGATTTTKAKTSGTTSFIIFLVLIAAAGYFLILRPQKRKQKRQREAVSEIVVGDEVLTVGGTVGTIVAIDAERFTIVTGTDITGAAAANSQPARLTFVRNALARKIELPPPPMDDASGNTAEGDAQ